MSGRRDGRLSLVGLGLCDEKDVSARGLEEIRAADVVFAEQYTSTLGEGALGALERICGKRIQLLSRKELEEGSIVIDSAQGSRVALLVAGDPMAATTHVDVRLRAAEKSIETIIVHAPSVLTAAPGLLGLQHYKLGRVATIPFTRDGYAPVSPYEVVIDNLRRGLHSVVLLDIDSDAKRFMTANEGFGLLLDMAGRCPGDEGLTDRSLACVVARAGAPDCLLSAGTIGEMKARDFGPPLHTIIIPGKLHFMEEEALRAFAGLSTQKDTG
jgi:diphthine synthase